MGPASVPLGLRPSLCKNSIKQDPDLGREAVFAVPVRSSAPLARCSSYRTRIRLKVTLGSSFCLRLYTGLISSSSRRSALPVAILAVDWAPLGGLERHFAFLPTVGADGFVHLSGTSVVAAPVSKTQFFHSFLGDLRITSGIPENLSHRMLLNGFQSQSVGLDRACPG
jgi:hypothetical protein